MKTKKLLRVKVNNLGYFQDLTAKVAFITYLIARLTLSFRFGYVLDCLGYFDFRYKQLKLMFDFF